jgi:hypothetical protein
LREYRFFSDANQALFEEALDRGLLSHVRVRLYTVGVENPPAWVDDLAWELGAECN